MSATSIAVTDESEAISGRSLLPNAWHLSFSQVIRRSFRMVVLFWTARLLGVASFGEYALLLTVVEMAAVVSGSGYISYLTREIAADPDAAWSLGSKVALVRLALIVPVIAIAVALLLLLHFPAVVAIYTAALGLSLFPRALSESAQGALCGLWRFSPLSWIEGTQGVILLATAPLLVLRGFGLKGVIVAEILAAIGGAVCALSAAWGVIDLRQKKIYPVKGLLRSLYAFNIFPFITNVYDRADVILLARFAGNFATGIYSLPYRVLGSLQIIPYGLMGALLPGLSAASEEPSRVRTDFSNALQFLYSAALFMVLGVFGFASSLVHWTLGPAYGESAVVIKILIWAAVPMFVNHALNILLLSAHHERKFLWTTAICTIFNITANLYFIPRYSFEAAAVITVLTELLLVGMNIYLVRSLLGNVELPRSFAAITMFFFTAFVLLAVFSRWTGELWAGALVCAAFAGAVTWFSRNMVRALWEESRRPR